MLRLAVMNSRDFPFAVELANTLGWNMAVEDFVFNSKLEPNGCFVALEDSVPVGISTCISYGRVGWFGNLAVKEDCRRKGVGSALVKHSIDYLKTMRTEIIGLYAYTHLVGFYQKFGFKSDQTFIVLKGKATNSAVDGNVRKSRNEDVSRLFAFDAKCYGSDRSKLLKSILEDKENMCYISNENGQILGFAMAKVYQGMAEIGPLICTSKHTVSSVALLRTILNRLKGLEVFIYLSMKHKALLDFLLESGFQKDFEVSRMFLGSVKAEDCICLAESLERG